MRVFIFLQCLLALALLPAGLVLAQAPTATATPGAAAAITYSGGDGSTIRKSIVIAGARDASEGAAAELEWIRQHLPGAIFQSRGQVTGPPHYDVVTVKLATGALMDLHFDITAFHGK